MDRFDGLSFPSLHQRIISSMTDKTTSGRGKRSYASGPATPNGWRKAFLSELAATSNIAASARKAKISASTAYEARRRDPDFYRRWQEALCEGYEHLEMNLLQRLREGEIKPPTGAKRGTRVFDNGTAFRLLTVHRESAARQRAIHENRNAEAVLDGINAKLDRMRERSASLSNGKLVEDESADDAQ